MSDLLAWLRQEFLNNQMASGAAVLVVMSTAVWLVRSLPERAAAWLGRRLVLEVEVRQPDPLHDWLSAWLGDHVGRNTRLAAVTRLADRRSYMDVAEETKLRVRLIPGLGAHLLRYRGRWLVVSRQRDEGEKTGEGGGLYSLTERESYYLRAPRWERGTIVALLEEARGRAMQEEGDGPDVYLAKGWGGWDRIHRAQRRPLESVILPDGMGEDLLARVRRFRDGREEYAARGLPWRLGILLHGPPGNGKTSLIMALASELGMDLGFINLSDDHIGDNDLIELLGSLGRGRVGVVEDVDAIYHGREKKEGGKDLSFSGLLNALDGVVSGEGRVVVMTTNHLDRLDDALRRPGRADLVLEVPLPGAGQLQRLYGRFHSEDRASEAALDFSHAMRGQSMAAAQGALLQPDEEMVGAG